MRWIVRPMKWCRLFTSAKIARKFSSVCGEFRAAVVGIFMYEGLSAAVKALEDIEVGQRHIILFSGCSGHRATWWLQGLAETIREGWGHRQCDRAGHSGRLGCQASSRHGKAWWWKNVLYHRCGNPAEHLRPGNSDSGAIDLHR